MEVTQVWTLDTAHKGKTLTVSVAPRTVTQPCLLIVSRSCAAEVRVCLASDARETRGDGGVLCFTVGQYQGTMAALGFGNPHVKKLDAGYRHCQLPEPTLATFWILCDSDSGWVALGAGDNPTPKTALLTSRMSGALRLRLGQLTCVTMSNWEAPVSASMCVKSADEARQRAFELQPARNKFDSDGQTIPIHGLTTVCELPPTSTLHLIMSRLHDALASEPALAGSYGLLPPSSYHMTTFDIISGSQHEQAVQAHAASANAATAAAQLQRVRSATFDALSAPMQLYIASTALQLERAGVLSSVPWTTFAMRAVGLDDTARTVELEPWDEQVAAALDSWREQVARCTGTYKAPLVRSVARWKAEKPRGHYRFHMTIAYVIFPLGRSNETSEALQRIVGCATPMLQSLGPVICRAPHLCHFSSMAAFHPVTLTDE